MADLRPSEKGHIMDLTNHEFIKFDINPVPIDESVKVNFARQAIPGLSHQRSQYINTENRGFSFSLHYDGFVGEGERKGPSRPDEAKQFLLSLCYPRASKRIDGAGVPKSIFVFGGLSVIGYLEELSFTHKIFYRDLQLRAFEAKIKFVEELSSRTTMRQVRTRRNRR